MLVLQWVGHGVGANALLSVLPGREPSHVHMGLPLLPCHEVQHMLLCACMCVCVCVHHVRAHPLKTAAPHAPLHIQEYPGHGVAHTLSSVW